MDLPETPSNMKGLAVAWFRKEDWPRWCSIDHDFQPDYDHWLRRSEKAFKHYESLGKRVVKVVIDPDEFLEWSHANGGKIDSNARAAYAGIKLMRKDTSH